MRTEAQRRAQNTYDAKTYATLTCKIKLEQAEAFRAYAAANGTTVNALLSGFVDQCLSGSTQQPHSSTGTGDD